MPRTLFRLKANSQQLIAFSLLLSLVERRRNYLRADHSTAHVHLNLLPDVRVFDRNVGHADVLLKIRRGAARRDVADTLAADVNAMTVARDAALHHLEADELAPDALLLLTLQSLAPREVAFVQFANPAEVGFQERSLFRYLMAVESHR